MTLAFLDLVPHRHWNQTKESDGHASCQWKSASCYLHSPEPRRPAPGLLYQRLQPWHDDGLVPVKDDVSTHASLAKEGSTYDFH